MTPHPPCTDCRQGITSASCLCQWAGTADVLCSTAAECSEVRTDMRNLAKQLMSASHVVAGAAARLRGGIRLGDRRLTGSAVARCGVSTAAGTVAAVCFQGATATLAAVAAAGTVHGVGGGWHLAPAGWRGTCLGPQVARHPEGTAGNDTAASTASNQFIGAGSTHNGASRCDSLRSELLQLDALQHRLTNSTITMSTHTHRHRHAAQYRGRMP